MSFFSFVCRFKMFLKGQLVVDNKAKIFIRLYLLTGPVIDINMGDSRGIPPKINYQLFALRYINDQDGRPQSAKPPRRGPQLGSAQSHRKI